MFDRVQINLIQEFDLGFSPYSICVYFYSAKKKKSLKNFELWQPNMHILN